MLSKPSEREYDTSVALDGGSNGGSSSIESEREREGDVNGERKREGDADANLLRASKNGERDSCFAQGGISTGESSHTDGERERECDADLL